MDTCIAALLPTGQTTQPLPGSHFAHALLADPSNELAWIWFATVAEARSEQRYCINRALAINPESAVRPRLRAVKGVTPKVPPELAELDAPVLPPDLQQVRRPLPVPLPNVRERIRPLARPRVKSSKDDMRHREVSESPTPLTQNSRGRNWHAGRWRWLALVLVPLVVLGAVWAAFMSDDPEPYTIAIVAPLTGDGEAVGVEQVRAAELAVDHVNDRGGLNGHPMKLQIFDDEGNPEVAAQRAEEIAADNSIMVVIGHSDSATSLAAGPIYQQAGIAVISPSANADGLTVDNPWQFSVLAPASFEGSYMAAYAVSTLQQTRVSVVGSSLTYSMTVRESFTSSFEEAGGTIQHTWQIDTNDRDGSIARIVSELATAQDPGMIILPLERENARAFLIAARNAGVTIPMFVAPSLGFDDFPDLFENEPREVESPGFYTNGIHAASPLIFDSIGGGALVFADGFRERYDTSPDWYAAKVWDAMSLGTAALERGNISESSDASESRDHVRRALEGMNSPDTGVQGLSSPLFFSSQRFVPQSLSIGTFDDGDLRSAPMQYDLVSDTTHLHLNDAERSERVLEIDGQTYLQYRVVYVGIDVNKVDNLNTASESFDADFFLWMRYTGDASASDIVFTNATDPSLAVGEPLEMTESANETYAMFRVQGTFSQPMDFHDYPWDTHSLQLGFQNKTLNDDDIIYVADAATLDQPQEERLLSGSDLSRPFNAIPNWEASRVWFSQNPQTSRSAEIDEDERAPGYVQFSEFLVNMTYARDLSGFLVKNLLPLALLVLVTYISLFFPAEQAGTRTDFAITSILTTSVLLGAISNQLPDIGYTVAIEWGFYAYIGFSAVLVLFNIVVERLHENKRYATVRRLDYGARILYPVLVLGVVAMYVARFT